jgi:putative glycosyltransferase (TIGR04372 family)
VGEFQLADHYFRRSLDARRALARKRGIDRPGLEYFLHTWTHNIGHMFGLDTVFKARQLGWRSPRNTVLMARREQIANLAYLNYFRPFLNAIITDNERIRALTPEAECLETYPFLLENRGDLVYGQHVIGLVNRQWEAEGRPPLLQLTDHDIDRGRARLKEMGVPPGAWYVGLHVREGGFHKEATRDNRSSNISLYQDAIQTVTRVGGWVIRMGDPTMTRLPPMAQVLDYAHHPLRCDWMDVFLLGSMRFLIGTLSGLAHVPHTFGVPTVLTNVASIGLAAPWFSRDIFLPQLVLHEKENRFLSLEEILRSGLGFVQHQHLYVQKGIRLLSNTSDDINAAVLEMIARLDGKPLVNPAHERIQRLFESCGALCNSQISPSFLRKHAFLLPRL